MEHRVAQYEKGIAIANQISVSIHQENRSIQDRLGILTDAAKYDVGILSGVYEAYPEREMIHCKSSFTAAFSSGYDRISVNNVILYPNHP
jgi:hypothetical protein